MEYILNKNNINSKYGFEVEFKDKTRAIFVGDTQSELNTKKEKIMATKQWSTISRTREVVNASEFISVENLINFINENQQMSYTEFGYDMDNCVLDVADLIEFIRNEGK